MLDQIIPRLLEGQFICETTAPALFRSLADETLRAEVDVLKADRERLEAAEQRLTEVEAENRSLRDEVDKLKSAAVLELEQRQQMIDHVSAVHDWIEGGAKPPPPARPPWAPRKRRPTS